MMKDVIVKIGGDSQVYLNKKTLGISGENLQGNIVFQFTDEFVDGIAWLELEMQNGEKGYLQCYKKDNEYYLPILSSLLTQVGNITMQLRITKDEDLNGIPIFKSNKFYLEVKEAINATTTIPEEYPQWIDVANLKLLEIDEAIGNIEEVKTYVTEQADYAKETSDNLNEKLNNGEFDGATFTPNVDEEGNLSWTNNKNLENPQMQNIRGPQGVMGPQGEAFKIKKTYASKEEMIADFDNMEVGDYVMITSNIEVEDNAKLYSRGETEWVFITDFSGATGIQGPQGPQGIQGIQGPQGPKGEKPIIGVDYYTPEQQAEIVAQITDNANSVFNENVDEKTNEFNTNAEAKVNEFNQNIDVLIEDVEDLYHNQLLNEASGEIIYLTDSANAKVSYLEVEGNSYQETTSGRNLYNFEDKNGVDVAITTDEDGWITINGDNTSGSSTLYMNYWTNNLDIKENTTYKAVVEIKSVSGNGILRVVDDNDVSQFVERFSITSFQNVQAGDILMQDVLTKASFEESIRGLRTYAGFGEGKAGSITFRISLLEDTSITADTFVYEPYTGGIASPNPDYPQEVEVVEGNIGIKVVGKNLWNKDDENAKLGYYNANGKFASNDTYRTISFKCSEGQSFIKSGDGWGGIITYWNNDTFVSSENSSVATIPSGVNNVRFACLYSSTNAQLEKGSVATSYEPYKEEITYIDLQGNFVGKLSSGVKDRLYVENNHLYLQKNVGKIVLDGSEYYLSWGLKETDYFSVYVDKFGGKLAIPNGYIISDHFPFSTYGVVANATEIGCFTGGNYIGISVPKSILSDSSTLENAFASIKKWLSINNSEFYYQLETPELIDLGYIKTPKTLEKTSNISLIANLETNMSLKYVQHTRSIIDNIQSQTENLDVEIKNDVLIDIQPILENIEDVAKQAEVIARGRATGYTFETVEDLDIWLQDETNVSKLVLGDNFYIVATDVPDYWWDGTQKRVLETEKPDLTDYAKKQQFVTLTQEEYDALETKSANTYYFIIEEE